MTTDRRRQAGLLRILMPFGKPSLRGARRRNAQCENPTNIFSALSAVASRTWWDAFECNEEERMRMRSEEFMLSCAPLDGLLLFSALPYLLRTLLSPTNWMEQCGSIYSACCWMTWNRSIRPCTLERHSLMKSVLVSDGSSSDFSVIMLRKKKTLSWPPNLVL